MPLLYKLKYFIVGSRLRSVSFEMDLSRLKGPTEWICFGFAACCALALAGCGASPPEASAEAEVRIFARADPWQPSASTEAAVLADRILRRESDDLLLDASRRRELGREIGRVLARIRDAYPAMAEISAREDHKLGTLLLGLEPKLLEAVSGLLDDERGSVPLRTARAEFDALNAKLGLWAVRPFFSTGVVAMYFDEPLNIDAARRAYQAMECVSYAEPDVLLGDGSDIEATKSRGTWHVIFRRAWGDCPSGCMYEERSFFTVDDDGVERIEPSRAKDMAGFDTVK